jgi:hypothetical protein
LYGELTGILILMDVVDEEVAQEVGDESLEIS